MSGTRAIAHLGALAGLALCFLAGSTQAARIALPFERTDLNGGAAGTTVPIVLPATVDIRRAQLVVTYATALAVEPHRSGLLVGLNGEPLVELPLMATHGPISAEIDIPAELLGAGTNTFSFHARQHHRADAGCAQSAFGELWTGLDRADSYLELDLVPRPGALTLRNLEGLLASSLYDGEAFTVVTARALDDALVLEWGGMTAETVALRRGQRPLVVRHEQLGATSDPSSAGTLTWNALRGHNVAVIGTFAELGDALPQALPEAAGEGLIAVRPLPADPTHVAIILSGGSEAAVGRAVEAFRSIGTTWPDVPSMALRRAGPPLLSDAVATSSITGGQSIVLAELGYVSQDLPLGFTDTLEVGFDLGEDYYAGDGQRIELALSYAYGAGLAPTSALIIRVNDVPWNMMRLDRATGDIVRDARAEVPMGLFQPGHNTIAFQPLLHPAGPETCGAIGDQPMFTLFDDSRIEVPRFAHLARQPDLRLFADRGFPYAVPDEGGTLVVVGNEPAAATAAWMLRGKLAQRHGGPLQNVTIASQLTATDRHLLVVGPLDALPDDIVAASSMPLGDGARGGNARSPALAGTRAGPARSPAPSDVQTERAHDRWAQRLAINAGADDRSLFDIAANWLIGMAQAVPSQAPSAGPSFEELWAREASADAGTMIAFRSPYARNRTATVVTAVDAASLQNLAQRLIEDDTWQQLDGDISVWSDSSDRVLSRRIAPTFVTKKVDASVAHVWLLWRTYMAEHPAYWLTLVFSLILCLNLVTGALLRRRAMR